MTVVLLLVGVISIHTPAKGVTMGDLLHFCRESISIHTPAKGVTIVDNPAYCERTNFNPHSREGSDDKSDTLKRIFFISIHTPAKGVTVQGILEIIHFRISIHTPAKGVTNLGISAVQFNKFQSTLPRRE